MWSRKQIGWISTSSTPWYLLVNKSSQLSFFKVYNDSLHILYRSVSPHTNWGKSGFKNALFGISLMQQTSEYLLCWVDTKWLSQKLLPSESQNLTGEADSPANYKHGRMCLRAVREAWTTYYRITDGGAHSPACGRHGRPQRKGVLDWIMNCVTEDGEPFRSKDSGLQRMFLGIPSCKIVTNEQHEAYFREKTDIPIYHPGSRDEKNGLVFSFSLRPSNITTLSERKSPEKHKKLFLLLGGCCCYYHRVRGLKGLF